MKDDPRVIERADSFLDRMEGNAEKLDESYMREEEEMMDQEEMEDPEGEIEEPKMDQTTDIGYFLNKALENAGQIRSYVDMAAEQVATLNEQEKAGLKGMLSKTNPKNASEAGAIAILNYLVK